MDSDLLQTLLTVLATAIASSGFWAFLDKRYNKKSLQTELLVGLAHDRIIWLGLHYISVGSITQEEYENLLMYLYKPYEALGGNGSARRIMQEVDKLPIKTTPIKQEIEGVSNVIRKNSINS